MDKGDRLSPAVFWARYDEMDEQIRASSTVLPCYGLIGWPGLRLIGNWEWENDRLATVGLGHGAPGGRGSMLNVRTTVRDPRADVVLLRMAADGRPTNRDEGEKRWRELESDDGDPVTIEVGTADVRFIVWHAEDRWWAAGQHDGHGLVLQARRIAASDVQLERVNDLEPYLAGRRAYLRERRGEA